MRVTSLLLCFAVLLSACAPAAAPTPTAPATPLPEGVRPLDPPVKLPDFRLTDQRNQPFTRQNFTDRWTVMSFGYTHCPDVCPITLANFTLTKRALGDQRDRVTFIFVSVDGARDTPEVLGRYLANFDAAFIGLTGDEMAIRPVTQAFGVRYEVVKPEGTQAEYLINHTASSFLVNPKGELVRIYSYGTDPEVVAADLKTLITN
ncbi:MAG: SCO family protein [Aggregatilineales bacterium]